MAFVPALFACKPPPKPIDLKSLSIAGVEPFFHQDESSVPLALAVTRLCDDFDAKGAARGPDGDYLAADEHTSNEAIVQAVSERLGDDWQQSTGFSAAHPAVTLLVWETRRGPKRFYGIAAWNEVYTSTDGRKYRPLMSAFTRAD